MVCCAFYIFIYLEFLFITSRRMHLSALGQVKSYLRSCMADKCNQLPWDLFFWRKTSEILMRLQRNSLEKKKLKKKKEGKNQQKLEERQKKDKKMCIGKWRTIEEERQGDGGRGKLTDESQRQRQQLLCSPIKCWHSGRQSSHRITWSFHAKLSRTRGTLGRLQALHARKEETTFAWWWHRLKKEL